MNSLEINLIKSRIDVLKIKISTISKELLSVKKANRCKFKIESLKEYRKRYNNLKS